MEFGEQILRVIAFLGLLGASLWLLRRRGRIFAGRGLFQPGRDRQLELVERLTLGPQHAIHLVRVGKRLMLIGTSPGGCQTLPAAETLPEPASRGDQAPGMEASR